MEKFRNSAGRGLIRCSHRDLGWMRLIEYSEAESTLSGSPLQSSSIGEGALKSLRC
jgi:hypothetical protein